MEPSQEIEIVKVQVSKALAAAESIAIESDEDMLTAGEVRKRIKTVGKMLEEQKKSATDPINKSLKIIRGWFKPLEEDYEKAENIVSVKMLEYQDIQRQQREWAREENAEKTEIKKEHPDAKVHIDAVPIVITKSENFHTRIVKKFRIVNVDLVPREFLIVDETAIRKLMMAGVTVSGVEYYEEKILV